MKPFDYFFYRVAFLFRQISVVGDLSSITIISIVEAWSIIAVINVLSRIYGKVIAIDELVILFFIAAILIIMNSLRYLGFRKFRVLHDLWKEEGKKSKQRRTMIMLAYMILSFVIYVFSYRVT